MVRLAQFLVTLLAASCAQAQVYKCVDSAGRVIYSQNPCPANTKSGTISRRLDAGPAAAPQATPAEIAAEKGDSAKGDSAKGDSAKSGAPKTPADQEQAFRKRQQERDKAGKESEQQAADAKRKEDNCRGARERLATFEIGGRITRINAQGERVFLDDAQLEQQRAAARAEVAQACN